MKSLKNVFFNPSESRFRAGWRILIFCILFILVSRILSNIGLSIVGDLDKTRAPYWVFRGVIVIIAGTLAVVVVRKYIDRKTFVSLGLQLDWLAVKDFVVGLLISMLMIGAVLTLLLLSGLVEIQEIGGHGRGVFMVYELFLWLFGIGLAVGWSEELVFRGYLLQNMREGMGLFWAVLVSCVLFGLLHMSNPNSTVLSGILVACFGCLHVFGWLRTGQLWLSIGMHVGWNFFQGPVMGFPVSGMNTESLVTLTSTGRNWLTGGSFGPEAGLLILPIILFGLLLMYYWTVNRKDIPWVIRTSAA